MGVNLGPVRLVKDLNGQVNIIGDGINVAQRVMSFARPGQLLVSRSFYEVVSCLSRDYASLFRHEGARTDKHVRDHEVYSVGGTPSMRRLSDTMAQTSGHGGFRYWLRGVGPLGLRRSALLAAPLVILFLVAGGVAARAVLESRPARSQAARGRCRQRRPRPVQKAAVVPRNPRLPLRNPHLPLRNPRLPLRRPRRRQRSRSWHASTRSRRKRRPPSRRLARASSSSWSPLGARCSIDGKSRGISPPLRVVELSPGAHTIEIRNSTFPAHMQKVQVKPGEAVRIQHRFK